MFTILKNLHSGVVSFLRLGRGFWAINPAQNQPQKLLEIYEFEACPYCRKVREVLSEMDLEYIYHPCPKGSYTNRNIVKEKGGRKMFPYLIDPNTDREMYQSEDIIDYLLTTYGNGRFKLARVISPLNSISASLASMTRPFGVMVRKGLEHRKQPEKLLELHNYEASPGCRRIREILNELHLDFISRNAAIKSKRRESDEFEVPYLIDPNTGTSLAGTEKIITYLIENYATA